MTIISFPIPPRGDNYIEKRISEEEPLTNRSRSYPTLTFQWTVLVFDTQRKSRVSQLRVDAIFLCRP